MPTAAAVVAVGQAMMGERGSFMANACARLWSAETSRCWSTSLWNADRRWLSSGETGLRYMKLLVECFRVPYAVCRGLLCCVFASASMGNRGDHLGGEIYWICT